MGNKCRNFIYSFFQLLSMGYLLGIQTFCFANFDYFYNSLNPAFSSL